jgi:hypothetical protein
MAMKVRAIILVDLDIDGSYKEVAEEQVKLEQLLEKFKNENSAVVQYALDIKERRSTSIPDLKTMKLKSA